MKIDLKTILIVILFLVIGGGLFYINRQKKELREEQQKARLGAIRNDSLVKISNGIYTKLVADSLTKAELRKKIKELGISLENALLAQHIVITPRDTIKIIDSIVSEGYTMRLTDYYPNKDNYFVKHITNLDTRDNTATGEYNFNPISLDLGIAQQKDGTYRMTTKFPKFFNVKSLDVQSLPLAKEKPNNIGLLFGVDYVRGLQDKTSNLDFNSYIRYKKFYIGGGYRTDNTVKAGIKIEW